MKRAATLGLLSTFAALLLLAAGIASGEQQARANNLPHRVYAPLLARDEPLPPTATPTAATFTQPPTATATPRPTATPTQATSGLSPQGGWLWFDILGYAHVTGVVVNYFAFPVEFVEVTGRFYGASGQLLATDSTYTNLRAIPAGSSSPYELLLIPAIPGITSGEVAVTDYDTDIYFAMPAGLNVTITNKVVDIIGYGHIYGTVKNNSALSWEFVEVIFAIVSGERVVSVESGYSKPHTLGPGQIGTFEVLVSPHAGIDPVNFNNLTLVPYVDASEP